MGKIVLSPRILGKHFGKVVLNHANRYTELLNLDKESVAKDLNSGATGDEYIKLFDKYFKDELILRMK